MAASFALFTLTCTHLGAFDPEWPGKPEYSELEELIPAKQLRNVLDLLTTNVQQAAPPKIDEKTTGCRPTVSDDGMEPKHAAASHSRQDFVSPMKRK